MNFWRNKRVFVTGHTGFKGSWLSLWLSHAGAHVFGYSNPPPTNPSLFEVAGVQELLAGHTIADVRDTDALGQAMERSNPGIVLHLAAQPLVRDSYVEPVETYSTNVMGTVNVLEACRRQSSVKAIIIVTSDKCYENRESMHAYRETDAMGGYDPYSSSKGCAELVTTAYARSFFDVKGSHCSVASVRAGNVIGGGDWARDRLMADLMRGLTSGRPTHIRSPRAIRPWQHVLEPLHGYLTVAERAFDSRMAWEAWNFGPNENGDRTVGEVAELTCSLWGRPDLLAMDSQVGHLHEAGLLRLDCSKAKERLGWQPCLNFADGISWTVEWFKDYVNRDDMRAKSLAQIDKYAALRAQTIGA